MKAIVKEKQAVSVQNRPAPSLSQAPDGGEKDVIVRVELAGLCRTDVYAAENKLKVIDPLILGHELAGTIEAVGAGVDGLKAGMRVTVNPILRCGKCNRCLIGASCANTGFVGLDKDGGFAELVRLPEYSILPLADDIGYLQAAYTEPVAASLAVLKSGILPEENGAILGRNRFSELLQLILDIYGFPKLPVFDLADEKDKKELAANESTFDYVIETYASTDVIKAMVKAIKPGGIMVLKSRQFEPVEFRLVDVLKKEPVVHVVNYGSFDDALKLLTSGRLNIDHLVDDVYPLEDFEKVFACTHNSENLKSFFDPKI